VFISQDSQDEIVCAQGAVIERFEAHIRDRAFPCVGAKSALSRQRMEFLVVGDLRCPRDDRTVYQALHDFACAYKSQPGPFQSFVVLFQTRDILTETEFETAMWARLQALEAMDAADGHAYDPRVSPDVEDPKFSLSFSGEAFFVVGLHPGASRPARAFDTPALVFNAHDQFETLRAEGRYETLRDSIINRDISMAGTPNPMLARHGERSEASQYSGRAVEEGWMCPFQKVHASQEVC
jgi:FPC/CPF motif-containing protein YcgG